MSDCSFAGWASKWMSILNHLTWLEISYYWHTMFAWTTLSKTEKLQTANWKCRIVLVLMCLFMYCHLIKCPFGLLWWRWAGDDTLDILQWPKHADVQQWHQGHTTRQWTVEDVEWQNLWTDQKPPFLRLKHIATTWKSRSRTYLTFRPWCTALATLQTNQ